MLVPGPDAKTVTPGETRATESVDDVTVTADPQAWNGNPQIRQVVTPMFVKIENNSDRRLRIRYSDFALIARNGERFAALPPFDIRGSVANPAAARPSPIQSLGFTYQGFYISPYYRLFYPSLSVYPAERRFHDPLYYDYYYPYWSRLRTNLPTDEMLRFCFPEGVLEAGGVIAGFLYFEKIDYRLNDRPNDRLPTPEVTFQANIVDIESGEMPATVEIPFVVARDQKESD